MVDYRYFMEKNLFHLAKTLSFDYIYFHNLYLHLWICLQFQDGERSLLFNKKQEARVYARIY